MILYHYTNEIGLNGILDSLLLHPSTAARNPRDARYGDGQYLSDVAPGSKTSTQLSRLFLNIPFLGQRFTHYVAIDVEGLSWIEGRPEIFVVPNDQPLDLKGRIVGSGLVEVPSF